MSRRISLKCCERSVWRTWCHVLAITRDYWGPFYSHVLTLIPAWMSNYINYDVWDEIAYPFQNFNGATIMWFTIMCSLTKFELNWITGLFANAQKLLDKSDYRKWREFSRAWTKVNKAWGVMSSPTKFQLNSINGLCANGRELLDPTQARKRWWIHQPNSR